MEWVKIETVVDEAAGKVALLLVFSCGSNSRGIDRYYLGESWEREHSPGEHDNKYQIVESRKHSDDCKKGSGTDYISSASGTEFTKLLFMF